MTNKSQYSGLMRRADGLRRGETDPVRCAWWSGYIRGLRRAHHGETFGTDAEHTLYLAAVDSPDPRHTAIGRGYHAGLTMTALEPDSSRDAQPLRRLT